MSEQNKKTDLIEEAAKYFGGAERALEEIAAYKDVAKVYIELDELEKRFDEALKSKPYYDYDLLFAVLLDLCEKRDELHALFLNEGLCQQEVDSIDAAIKSLDANKALLALL